MPIGLGRKELPVVSFELVVSELDVFIKLAKEESYKNGLHNVYALTLYENPEIDSHFCFTVGYIEGILSLGAIENFKYYFYYSDELILLNYSESFEKKFKIESDIHFSKLLNKEIIYNKTGSEFTSIGTFKGLVYCNDTIGHSRVLYDDSDNIPKEKTIFPIKNSVEPMLIDSSSLKKIINR